MSSLAQFVPETQSFTLGNVTLSQIAPMVDGEIVTAQKLEIVAEDEGWSLRTLLDDGRGWSLSIHPCTKGLLLTARLHGAGMIHCDAIGVRFGLVHNVERFLRNGYTSWDGSYFVEPRAATQFASDPKLNAGYAMTAFVPPAAGVAVAGFLRHDRFQSRLSFDFADGSLAVGFETLIDRVPHIDEVSGEEIILFAQSDVEEGLRDWARRVAETSDQPARVPPRRISGWCSWYSLYASLDPEVLESHLAAMARYVETTGAGLTTFLIDDGFTPEMGDWLTTKPQFPHGMAPILGATTERGFQPGLWIAPFMVGNRSALYRDHPDWVVRDRETCEPLAPMKFYGEFRWHKRSEAYYVLDVTHPDAESYIRSVFRTWTREWGCRYFKTDFMHLGSMYGPSEARWHREGLSRMDIWMIMVRLIREEIGDAQWLLCGAPIWAPVGLADAVRIGRDVGVRWDGDQSAQSLLRDQTSRNFANGILWQADPDCILLRENFHHLSDDQVRSLALFAGLAGGVLMTSDNFDELSPRRKSLFTELAARESAFTCEFPELGRTLLTYEATQAGFEACSDPILVQRVSEEGSIWINVFNTGAQRTDKHICWDLAGIKDAAYIVDPPSALSRGDADGLWLDLAPYQSALIKISPP
ncbi:glycoside hydrolase family 36 protein [Pelagibacterium luteolum]|uniref:Melibiase n=1 Tax=Pelagibacterium luteolum TaxID=440168 RepID=A0A1G7VFH4_9HYPH|nr:glycoside hydrolase family 36 protein [Pelagibacterium luteolum]SDG58483.1 Melibiase [Pelagibacterium luteolum]